MTNSNKPRKLKGKDLITIGIFTAIYFVLNQVFNFIGGVHAIVWFLSPALAALVAATPYMLLCAKVKKPFASLTLGTIVGLIYLASGMFSITVPIVFFVGGIIAEIIRYLTHYSSFWGDATSFSFVALGMVASPLPLWLNPEAFIAQIKSFGMSQSYIDTCTSLTSPIMLVIMIVATVICAFIGAFIAKALFKKHFVKAGMVS